jgi:pimeloyl-ACP methyl ester carboxylesterase
MTVRSLQHGKVHLALHTLRADAPEGGRPLLILHGLGERTPKELPEEYASWPGPVFGLDFTGHGDSTVPRGGGYTAELLMADVDIAIQEIGAVSVVGRGLGGYVAVLIAGGRPELVRGAIVCDGPGLAGGGGTSPTPYVATIDPRAPRPPDPYALAELAHDVRPPDYATSFARQAMQLSGLGQPISVCAVERPEWLDAVVREVGVEETSLPEALDHCATLE